MSWKWHKIDKVELARLVLDDATRWLTDPRMAVNWNDLHGSPDARRTLVKALYETLLLYRISYTPEKYHPDQALQLVRTPDEILDRPREGTCLDLSLLFCGLCLGCDLIPWLVRVWGHAFVMVSLSHRLPEWCQPSRPEWKDFRAGPLIDAGRLKERVDGGWYLAVECTGFARSATLAPGLPEGRSRDTNGLLPFDAAVAAGRAQFDEPKRELEYVIDMAVARYEGKVGADPPRSPRRMPASGSSPALPAAQAAAPARELDDLPLLTNRAPQKQKVIDSLDAELDAHAGRPAVFFIEGDLNQKHADLVRRLVKFDLPEWLALRTKDPRVVEVSVTLPAAIAVDFDKALRRELGVKLTIKGCDDPSWDDLTARLRYRPGRLLFNSTFATSDWEQDRSMRLDRLLQSWEQCRDLPPERAPIVCLQVVYEQRPAPGLLDRLFCGGNPNDRLLAYLGELGVDLLAGKKYPGIKAVRLERLGNITAGHLIAWQDLEPVRVFSRGADFTPRINDLFQDPDTGGHSGLPMVKVVPHLREWLRPYTQRR